jgi:hypothetical protein
MKKNDADNIGFFLSSEGLLWPIKNRQTCFCFRRSSLADSIIKASNVYVNDTQ